MHTKNRFVLNVFIIAFILIVTLPFISLAQGNNSSTVKSSAVVESIDSSGVTEIKTEMILRRSTLKDQSFMVGAYFYSSNPDNILIRIISISNKKHYDKDSMVNIIPVPVKGKWVDEFQDARKPKNYVLTMKEGMTVEQVILELNHSVFSKLIKNMRLFIFPDDNGFGLDSGIIDIWNQFYSTVRKFTGQIQSKPMESKATLDDSLRAAVTKEDVSAVQNLLSKGADPNIKTIGIPILVLVAVNENESIFQALIDAGADVNAKTADGFTPLIMAAPFGNSSVMQILLAKNANVDAKTDEGVTALMLVSQEGYLDIAQALLANGADVCATDNKGLSALNYAQMTEEILNKDRKNKPAVEQLIRDRQSKLCVSRPSSSASGSTSSQTEQSPSTSKPNKESKTKKTLKGILNRVIKIN